MLNVPATDWQDAIRKGGELLLASGYIEERYITAMIDAVNEYGPYIVLVPGVAMPHSRGENGVIKTGMSLITLAEPIDFLDSENNPVRIVTCLGAAGSDAHIEALQDFARLFESDENISALKDADDIEEVIKLIQKF